MFAQPLREYRFHDDLPGGIDRPPLLTLGERPGRQSWYDLRDEQGRTVGAISRRLGKWRDRGFEPQDPETPADEGLAAAGNLTGKIHAWSEAASKAEPGPAHASDEIAVTIVRDYLNLASIIGGLVSGPIGVMLALSGPWKRLEFRRGSRLVATGHRLHDGSAMQLQFEADFDVGGDAILDRRHMLALAVLSLSVEAER